MKRAEKKVIRFKIGGLVLLLSLVSTPLFGATVPDMQGTFQGTAGVVRLNCQDPNLDVKVEDAPGTMIITSQTGPDFTGTFIESDTNGTVVTSGDYSGQVFPNSFFQFEGTYTRTVGGSFNAKGKFPSSGSIGGRAGTGNDIGTSGFPMDTEGDTCNGLLQFSVERSGDIPPRIPIPGKDMNFDGRDDLMWRNTTTGETSVWLMNASGTLQGATFPGAPMLEWAIRGLGDVPGTGPAGVVWRNTNTGSTSVWVLNDKATLQGASYPGKVGLESVIKGVGDVNGDGRSDLVWRDTTSGGTTVWLMNDQAEIDEMTSPGGAGMEWAIKGIGDVNGDSRDDIVWRDTSSGATSVWLMNGSGTVQQTTFPGGAGLEWMINGVGDVNGDGRSDLLWRDTSNGPTSGATAVWLMTASGTQERATFPGGAELFWVIKGLRDVTGDGRSDVVWRNTTNGATSVWLMNTSATVESTTFPGGAGLEWELQP